MTRPAKVILFDIDGTIALRGALYPGVVELVRKLNASNLQPGFLTNNSTVGPGAHYRRLCRLGLEIRRRNVLTSAEATCLMLKDFGLGPKLYILGTRAFRRFLAGRGYSHSYENASAVLVGFDTELTYRKLTEATRLLLNGIPLVASHADPVCPGPLPDAGMLLACLQGARSDLRPLAVAGKPNKWIVDLIRQRFHVEPAEIIMVGDRLNTDIRFANDFGMRSILVLNGKEPPTSFTTARPDIVVPRIAQVADEFWPEALGWA